MVRTIKWAPKILIPLILFLPFTEKDPFSETLIRSSREEIAEGRRKMRAIEEALSRERQKLIGVQKEEKRVISELDIIEREISSKKREILKIQEKLKRIEGEKNSLAVRIHNIEAMLREEGRRVKERLVARYKLGGGGYIKFLFSAPSPVSVANRIRYMDAIIQYDKNLMEEYERNLNILRDSRSRLKEEEEELARGKEWIEREEKELRKKEAEKRQILRTVKARKELYLEAIREYEQDSRELQRLIKDLEQKGSRFAVKGGMEEGDFESLKGRIPFPVKGRICKLFGKMIHPELNTYVFNKGIGIDAPLGAKVRSVSNGQVIFSDWLKGYGNVIIIDHGKRYYTLYAHLSRSLKDVGDNVKGGDIIGLVGDTGSMEGTYLHFEIRHNGIPINPLDWLVKKGE
jgi:septal ring factor EnvC (AmiA/AmiB activator)